MKIKMTKCQFSEDEREHDRSRHDGLKLVQLGVLGGHFEMHRVGKSSSSRRWLGFAVVSISLRISSGMKSVRLNCGKKVKVRRKDDGAQWTYIEIPDIQAKPRLVLFLVAKDITLDSFYQ